MGNKQPKYDAQLKIMRPVVETSHERIMCFKFEVERTRATQQDRMDTVKAITDGTDSLETVLSDNSYDIPANERHVIRQMKEDLAVLRGSVEDHQFGSASPEAERILTARMGNSLENLREFMRWLDAKLEKKWWLAELIMWLKTLLLLATFVSATVSVVYPQYFGNWLTLVLTVGSGVLSILESILVKGVKPDKINLFSTTASDRAMS